MAGRVTQERTLGAILGLGIGDALGMPVTGRTPQEIAREFGKIDDYHGRTFADGAELSPGEFTDETEIALCIMETYTSAFMLPRSSTRQRFIAMWKLLFPSRIAAERLSNKRHWWLRR